MKIAVASIQMDYRLYPRNSVQPVIVQEYAEALKAGIELPPIWVAYIEGRLVLIDGAHRLGAHRACNLEFIEVKNLGQLTLKQAYIKAVEANAAHGIRFSPQEIKSIISQLQAYGVELEKISKIVSLSVEKITQVRFRISGAGRSRTERPQFTSPIKLGQAASEVTATPRVVVADASWLISSLIELLKKDKVDLTANKEALENLVCVIGEKLEGC